MNTALSLRSIAQEPLRLPAPQETPPQEAPPITAPEEGLAEKGVHFLEKTCGGLSHAGAGLLTGSCVGAFEGAKIVTQDFWKNASEEKSQIATSAVTAATLGSIGIVVGRMLPPYGSLAGLALGFGGTAAAYMLDKNEEKWTSRIGKVLGKTYALIIGPVVGGLAGATYGAVHGVVDGWRFGYKNNAELIEKLNSGALS
ncbi:MAG: hypothetical protein HYU64_12540 [Armatimonadetes bacterium]|nr:hypothetical protein [Armatimonadota bacterium]